MEEIKTEKVVAKESTLKQYCDNFDREHLAWSMNDYIDYALKQSPHKITALLKDDWEYREAHHQNIVASIEGQQGLGKSIPFLYASSLAGKIYKRSFKLEDLYFEIEELNEALGVAEPRQTFMKDEHRKTVAGVMSNMQEANLADFEDQLRINQNNLFYTSVQLQNHSHFFVFEAKHILWNEDGTYPTGFLSMLKTKRYTNPNQLVWRGYVLWPMPNEKIVQEYDVKKRAHIELLKKRFSTTLTPVKDKAAEIFSKRHKDLVRVLPNGEIKPIKSDMMMFVIDEEIGSGRFTIKGYEMLKTLLRKIIEDSHKEDNLKIKAGKTNGKEVLNQMDTIMEQAAKEC